VTADLPATADDPPDREVQPAPGASYLDLLPAREPEPTPNERILEHHGNVLELLIQIRRPREVERHPHYLRRGAIDVQRADDARLARIARAHGYPVHLQRARGKTERKRIADGKLIVV